MLNKILIIVTIVFILIAGVFALWLYVGDKPVGEKIDTISNFFPFGDRPSDTGQPEEPRKDGDEVDIVAERKEKLIQLTDFPVSGAIAVADGASTSVRYVEKSTGHIYEIGADGENKKRISNMTMLKTFQSVWSYNANKAVVRYFDDASGSPVVQNFSVKFGAENSTGIFLPKTIREISFSPAEEKLFYLAKTSNGVSGVVSSFENKTPKEIFSLPFGEFNVDWPAKNTIVLLTKPSNGVGGYLYYLNSSTGAITKILNGINGLTALVSPSLDKIIYNRSLNGSFSTFIYDVNKKESIDFSLVTMTEKCVWSKKDKNIVYCAAPDNIPNANYPDEWYQGVLSFVDSIWKINIGAGGADGIYNINMDSYGLFLDKEEKYLFFINKTDNTLWSLSFGI